MGLAFMNWFSFVRCIGTHVAMCALASFVLCATMEAQENPDHPLRYRLVEIGTFGGPGSTYNVFSHIGRNDGTFVAAADTETPDPYPFACFDASCFVMHALIWRHGLETDLRALPGGPSSYTNAINAHEWIVGHSQNGEVDPDTGVPRFIPTLWRNEQIVDLGTLGGSFGTAYAVNDRNLIAGIAENATVDNSGFAGAFGFGITLNEIHSVAWKNGKIVDLGSLGGPGSVSGAMNNRGMIVGASPKTYVAGPPFGIPPVDPFVWEDGKMTDLGSLGGTGGSAGSVNDRGQVVGVSDLAGDANAHPFLWERGRGMKDIGHLGDAFGTAELINEAGDVVGFSVADGVNLHAFFWNNGHLRHMGFIEGDNNSRAFGMNNKGHAVGQSWGWDGQEVTSSHAFVWRKGGQMMDLNTLVTNPSVFYLFEADYITDSGWIAAYGVLPNGDVRGVILIPETKDDDAATNFPSTASAESAGAPARVDMQNPKVQDALKQRLKMHSSHSHPLLRR